MFPGKASWKENDKLWKIYTPSSQPYISTLIEIWPCQALGWKRILRAKIPVPGWKKCLTTVVLSLLPRNTYRRINQIQIMNKCNSQSLVSMVIRGSKKVSEVISAGQNLFLFWHACNVLPRLFLTDCLESDFGLKICLVRMPASEIKSKENPSSSSCAFGFSARRACVHGFWRVEKLWKKCIMI